jgi:pilus assembly protein Flp/PilA
MTWIAVRLGSWSQDTRSDRGASLVEYALVIALIAVVCIAAVTFFGGRTTNSFSTSTTSLFG